MAVKEKSVIRFCCIAAMALAFLGIMALATTSVEAKPHWYSGKVINDKTIPSAAKAAPHLENKAVPPSAPVLFDIVVSLYNYPVGDDDGNTQGNPGSEQQDKYERILQYFADAVYESTEGAHKIRKIRIYRRGRYSSQADIFWDAVGIPGSPTNGISVGGQRIDMFDTFLGWCGAGCNRDMLSHEEEAGYTLAHEWAHVAQGVQCWDNEAEAQLIALAVLAEAGEWAAVYSALEWMLALSAPQDVHKQLILPEQEKNYYQVVNITQLEAVEILLKDEDGVFELRSGILDGRTLWQHLQELVSNAVETNNFLTAGE